MSCALLLVVAGGPHGAMATLGNALSAHFGQHVKANDEDLSKLILVSKIHSKEDVVAHTLRELLLQQMAERLQMKEKVRPCDNGVNSVAVRFV